jgi:hypothetical protein
MTQPKFPWALLLILAMFTFVAVSPVSPPWIKVLGILAVIITAAAAVYQAIPREDHSLDEVDFDPADDPWSDEKLS